MLARTLKIIPGFFKATVKRDWLSQANEYPSIACYIKNLQNLSADSLTKLDLSQYQHPITMEISLGEDVSVSPLTKALMGCSAVRHVDISGHKEIQDYAFSRFRKCLPLLKTLTLKNILPGELYISTDQIIKYYAQDIVLEGDKELMQHLADLSSRYLTRYGQVKYALYIQESGLSAVTLKPEYFQAALSLSKEVDARREQWRKVKFLIEDTINQFSKKRLFEDYKQGKGFNKTSPWYYLGPSTEADLPKTDLRPYIFTLYVVITKLNLWNVVAKGPGKSGFIFSSPDELNAVYNHPAVLADNHSGFSLGNAMRHIEYIANHGVKDYTACMESAEEKAAPRPKQN